MPCEKVFSGGANDTAGLMSRVRGVSSWRLVMDSGMLIGVVYVIIRIAILAGLIYYAVTEIIRERHKK